MNSSQVNVNPPEWGGDEAGPLNGELGERLAEFLTRLVLDQPNVKSVCDLGCGTGYLAGRLDERGYSVVGIDASRPYIETAQKQYASASVSFAQALFGPDLVESLGAGRFDLVISADVIEHLYRPADLLDTASGLLKPGGVLILMTPYYGFLKNLAIALLGMWDQHHGVHWDGGHIKFFSVPTLRAAVERAGFDDPRFVFAGRLPWLWRNMVCVARRSA